MRLLYISICCLSLSLMTGCSAFTLGFQSDTTEVVEEDEGEVIDGVDGPTAGHFDDEGNWIPDDPTIAMTYRIPDISSGFLFDARRLKVTPTISVELFEFKAPWKYLSNYKVDLGVGYQRVFGYLGIRLTSIFEISVGAVGGWDWDTNDYFYGPAFTIIKF